MRCCGTQEPGAVVPDPVALWELLQEWDEELKIFFDEQANFLLRQRQTGFLCCMCIRIVLTGFGLGVRVEFTGKDILQDEPAVIPDSVVLWILS